MGPRLLLLNTATPAGSVALTAGEVVVAELLLNLAGPHSDRVLPSVELLLREAGWRLEDLAAVAVVAGPGSFTGLRVGIASAKGLALGAGKPLIGISSLQALACQAPGTALPVCSLLDARKQEVYAGLFQWQNGTPRPLGAEQVIDPEQLLQQLSGDTLFVGEGAQVYRTLIVRHLGPRAHFVPWPCHPLRVSSAAPLALAALEAGETVSAASLQAVYIRRSEAELMQERQAGTGALSG